jgi:hypothetical protein
MGAVAAPRQAERACCLQVDDQLQLCWSQQWQVCGLLAFENAAKRDRHNTTAMVLTTGAQLVARKAAPGTSRQFAATQHFGRTEPDL